MPPQEMLRTRAACGSLLPEVPRQVTSTSQGERPHSRRSSASGEGPCPRPSNRPTEDNARSMRNDSNGEAPELQFKSPPGGSQIAGPARGGVSPLLRGASSGGASQQG